MAFGVAGAISAVFAIAAPFAAIPLVHIPAFLPLHESAVIVNDLLTGAGFAVLFCARGERGLLFLFAGYLWTALLAAAHLLSFPGVLTPTGLWAGPQTAAWLYIAWHSGLPAAVMCYVVADSRTVRSPSRALLIAGLAVGFTVTALVVLCTGGYELLPVIMQRDNWKPLESLICGGISVVAAVGLGRLWGGRQGVLTRLDLSLAVVLYAWIGEMLLTGVFNVGRYDLGWYAGRFFGLLAVSLVLYQMLLLLVVEHRRRAR